MLTKAAKYAIRATTYLAVNSESENKVNVKNIAKDIEVPLPFLAKILQQLTKAKLISSSKGPNGGFYLSDENKSKTIWDIICCIDGEEKFNECFLGLPDCSNENPCAVHSLVVSFRNKMMKEFRDKDISKVADIIEGNRMFKL